MSDSTGVTRAGPRLELAWVLAWQGRLPGAHGGEITVVSNPIQGITFTVILPKSQPSRS